MDDMEPPARLDEIPTVWQQVRQAQADSGPAGDAAREILFRRYAGAVRRYLVAVLGDEAAAADLTQEFALAMVQGKFRLADPKLGRFRDYLKSVLFHLISHYRRQKRHASVSAQVLAKLPGADADSDRHFRQSWRDELLARAWAALVDRQSEFFTVLHVRAVHPDLTAEQLAVQLRPQLGRDVSVDNVRHMLQRARRLFADLLLAEITSSLKHPTVESVQQELCDLDLLPYFQRR
jgi:RNA polymerase sigma factor (sigma-70 family)